MGSLAVDRMKDKALWSRLSSNLIELQDPWPMTATRRAYLALESSQCVHELRMRGTQLSLHGGERK